MATNPTAFTVDDVPALELPDGVSGYEFVDGRLEPVMWGSPLHGEMIVEIAACLWYHVKENGRPGEVWSDARFVLGLGRDRERLRGPDVSYIQKEKLAGIDPVRLFRGVPDLAIEVDLASGRKPGGQQRIVDYLEAGVRLVWAIDPHSRTAMMYRPDGTARLVRSDEELDGEDVVAGFRLRIAELFD